MFFQLKLIGRLLVGEGMIVGKGQMGSIGGQMCVSKLNIMKDTPERIEIGSVGEIVSRHTHQDMCHSIGHAPVLIHGTRAFVGMNVSKQIHIRAIFVQKRFDV